MLPLLFHLPGPSASPVLFLSVHSSFSYAMEARGAVDRCRDSGGYGRGRGSGPHRIVAAGWGWRTCCEAFGT
ncbi:hypothetical protein P171DRAFT_427786 [Karstenula rhodostoma CBS 690.94]|uniref:Uncharacterized protein n=1 Tax=Karstenula rhodostoma CBS 690.94 TaxID=1392251 RepID=A0A9P4PSX7_9PLEO|nr:hypothetical protein P171DRAFT_427786 [Karstenula rhodostoma CBS 690.94]